jgi:glyoxylate reductase
MQMHGVDVGGRTLGIVGAGRIGTAVGLRSTGFAMSVLYVDQVDNPRLDAIGARRMDLTACLADSDFVTLHTPLTDSTRHLIGPAELNEMKPSAVLINTSRGAVVDEAALIEALGIGRIAAAGLDVYEQEPAIPAELRSMDNVVCLPHLGSATQATRLRMGQIAVENLLAALEGREPPDRVGR